MTKEAVQAWMSGWRAVEKRQREELRKESFEEKFRALAFLMASTDLFDTSLLDAEDAVARERWARLRSLASLRDERSVSLKIHFHKVSGTQRPNCSRDLRQMTLKLRPTRRP